MSGVIAVLGLGEAGSLIARDLAAAGAAVRGFDPGAPAPAGVTAAGSDAEAVTGAGRHQVTGDQRPGLAEAQDRDHAVHRVLRRSSPKPTRLPSS